MAFFKRLAIVPVPATRPAYNAVAGCTYRSVKTGADGKYSVSQLEMSVVPARDRLLIRLADARSQSTALIGNDGKMYDFNLAGFEQPATAETFGALARRRASAQKPLHGAESHVINELAMVFPHYPGASMNPGQSVSSLTDETGRIWARYIYRGTTTYEGREVFVLDLVRRSDANPRLGERTIGFSLVDRERMIPALLIVESIQKIHLQQVRCR